MSGTKNSPTRSVDRAIAILECFLEKDEMILLEIAERTELSSSTVLRILNALQEKDFVIRNQETKTYRLGSKILWLAEHAKSDSYDHIVDLCLPYMMQLNEKHNEDVRLFVPIGNTKLCIKSLDSKHELRQVIKEGSRHDLIRGAAGKIILTYMKESDRRKVIPKGYNTDFIPEIMSRGYAISNEEREEGLFGIAIPVFDSNKRFLGAISMSGPTARFDNDLLGLKIRDMVKMSQMISGKA